MAKKLLRQNIPYQLRKAHPDLSADEIKFIVNAILKAKTYKLRTAHIVDFTIPYLGRIKTYGHKKVRHYKKRLISDKLAKRKKRVEELFTIEKLLF